MEVKGLLVDDATRCEHYHSELDIIAIKMHCCNTYYACITCHNLLAQHPSTVWPKNCFNEKAILCGSCKTELTINEYLNSNNICKNCNSNFNPKCSNHYHLYFEQ